jgi:CDP-diacylglycerol--inositol 3-phosphatidyltransferase
MPSAKKAPVTPPSRSFSPPVKKKKAGSGENVTPEEVLLYAPNLIGYGRVLAMLAAFYFFFSEYKYCMGCYTVAFMGDAIDGYVARMMNQSSKYGGVLDMVTDRISSAGFMALLAQLYPEHAHGLALLICLDVASHWFHVVSIIMIGNDQHHKSAETLKNRNFLLRWYYAIYPLFGYCCVGTEFFYMFLYLYYWTSNDVVWKLCIWGCAPACAIKNIINLAQLVSACYAIAEIDTNEKNRAGGSAKKQDTPAETRSRGRSTRRK